MVNCSNGSHGTFSGCTLSNKPWGLFRVHVHLWKPWVFFRVHVQLWRPWGLFRVAWAAKVHSLLFPFCILMQAIAQSIHSAVEQTFYLAYCLLTHNAVKAILVVVPIEKNGQMCTRMQIIVNSAIMSTTQIEKEASASLGLFVSIPSHSSSSPPLCPVARIFPIFWFL